MFRMRWQLMAHWMTPRVQVRVLLHMHAKMNRILLGA